MMRAIDQSTFQPKIAFKTRYGMVANPYSQGLTVGSGALTARTNKYYRMFRIDNLVPSRSLAPLGMTILLV